MTTNDAMTRETIDCDVEIPSGLNKFGVFANAFRVIPEAGNECFLDFCVYSAQENKAQVVSRIRVSQDFLEVILDRLAEEMDDLSDEPVRFVVRNGVMQTADGRLILMSPGTPKEA